MADTEDKVAKSSSSRKFETVRMRSTVVQLPTCKFFRLLLLCLISILAGALLMSSFGYHNNTGARSYDDGTQWGQSVHEALGGEDPAQQQPIDPEGSRFSPIDDITEPRSQVEAFESERLLSYDTPDMSEERGRYPIGQGGLGGTGQQVSSLLDEGLVQSDVHYLWCGSRWFEFKHYLGVKSVLRAISPDKIYLHYEAKIEMDQVFYNQWIDDLKYDYPWLHLRQMDADLAKYCSTQDHEERVQIILRLLNEDGGMYVGERTWMLKFPANRRLVDLDFGLERQSTEGYIVMRRGLLSDDSTSYKQLLQNTDRTRYLRSTCAKIHHIYRRGDLDNVSSCLILSGHLYERFYPIDIWELDDPFGRLARMIFYGSAEVRRPVPSYRELVPNIGHMIWIGGGAMDYVFYLSLLSLLYVAKVDVVYLHGDAEPAGQYWKEIKSMEQTKHRVKFIMRTPPEEIYQGMIEGHFRALMSDLIRVDLMIKYGGIYTDTDAIWVKPLSREDRGYEAVASFDWVDWSWPFPDSVNFGVSYGKKNAPFWRIFRDSMRTLHNDVHGFSGVMMPYKLLERYPHLLRIDRRLQVICYHSKCHPIYFPDYHNMSKDHTNTNSIPNWREDVNAFHWTHPNPAEYANRSTLLAAKGMFAEIGRNVLRSAGLL